MQLGAFSISLNVADLAASLAFYEALDFEVIMGDADQGWLILQNGLVTLGLFHGMFEANSLTFNPGWTNDPAARELDEFTDVREIQKVLEHRGLTLTARADESTSGPAHIALVDPDGNPVLIDQHR